MCYVILWIFRFWNIGTFWKKGKMANQGNSGILVSYTGHSLRCFISWFLFENMCKVNVFLKLALVSGYFFVEKGKLCEKMVFFGEKWLKNEPFFVYFIVERVVRVSDNYCRDFGSVFFMFRFFVKKCLFFDFWRNFLRLISYLIF